MKKKNYNSLSIHRVIVCFTIDLCITNNKKFFLGSYNSIQYLLKCYAFGSVSNKTNMGLMSLLKRIGLN